MRKNLFTLLIAVFAVFQTALAADGGQSTEDRLRQALSGLLPNMVPDSIQPAGFAGLYEVTFGARLVYITEDGRYLFQGKAIDLETRTPLTDRRVQELKQEKLASLDEKDMIVYGDANSPHTITVFTDIDCGYCRKLHSEMDQYNERGIRVRYLAYPRAGLNSPSARVAESVWCAEDRNQAMDTAKRGGSVPVASCDSPVAEHYSLGRAFGISGTPVILFEDGEVVPGYVPPARLIKALEQDTAQLSR